MKANRPQKEGADGNAADLMPSDQMARVTAVRELDMSSWLEDRPREVAWVDNLGADGRP